MAKTYVRRDSLVMREVAGQTLLIPVHADTANLQRVFVLNPVARCLWEALATPANAGQLLETVLDGFDAKESAAGRDIEGFLTEMLDIGAIEEVCEEA